MFARKLGGFRFYCGPLKLSPRPIENSESIVNIQMDANNTLVYQKPPPFIHSLQLFVNRKFHCTCTTANPEQLFYSNTPKAHEQYYSTGYIILAQSSNTHHSR